MFFIRVPDMNDSLSMISIDRKKYYLRFTYNDHCDYWSFGIYNADRKPIVAMIKIVPNFPLRHFYTDVELPDGVFGCLSHKETVTRYSFINGDADFVYIPRVELEDDA